MKIANGKPFPARDVYQFHTHPKPKKREEKGFHSKENCAIGVGENIWHQIVNLKMLSVIMQKSWTYCESMQERANTDRMSRQAIEGSSLLGR